MEELFNLVKNYGYIVRTNDLNGLASWNEMKALIPSITCKLDWSIKLYKIDGNPITSIGDAYKYVHVELGMEGEDNPTEKSNINWEKFHFFLQLVRIPYKNPICDLVRLAQVAYNLGQLSAVYDDSVYTPKVKQFYHRNNLDVMSTYTSSSCSISPKDLKKINKLVESKIVGSGYLYKYLKYKNKYLQLKNQSGGVPFCAKAYVNREGTCWADSSSVLIR
jgi:hypothetical protein